MLQAIHDNLKGVFAIVILGVLAVVFVFWGVEFVSVGGLTSAQGIEVNGTDMNVAEVRRDFQEQLTRYQVALGDSNLPEETRERLKHDVLEGAIRMELVRQRTHSRRFRATNEEVLASLREIPAFQVEGKFSRDAYYAALRAANIEPAFFEAQQRELIAARQLDRGIYSSAFVLPGELTRRQALSAEVREIAWVVLPAAQFSAGVRIDEAALADFYERHKQEYRTEERVNLRYVELDLATLVPQVEVTDEALRAYYEDNIAQHATSERRRARHILITAGADNTESRAKAAYDRAAAGEDFAKLAGELSQDPGSAANGGDLGWAEKSVFVGPFAEAVWSMQPGEIKGPVRSEFGWHVIKLEEIEASRQQSFDEVREELESEYRRAKAEELFGDLQEQLDTVSFEAAGDLERVATDLALPIQSLNDFTHAGGGALGASPALIKAVFDATVLSGEQLATAQLGPGRVVAIKVVAHAPPGERPLDDVRGPVTEALRTDLARQGAAARATALVEELRSGTAWAVATRPWAAADGSTPRFVGRDDPTVPPAVSAAAFKAGSTAAGPRYGLASLASDDTAIWVVNAVMPGTLASLPQEQRVETVRSAREQSAYQDSAVYVHQLRAEADVKINPRLFE